MLVDDFMAVYDFHEVHRILIQASPGRIFSAIKSLTPAEIPMLRMMLGIRSLPAFFAGRAGVCFSGTDPLLEQALGVGFVYLGEDADREILLGTIGQFWKPLGGSFPKVASAQEFLSFSQPGHAKAVINFHIDGGQHDRYVIVSTETRIITLDMTSRQKFHRYWRLISPGSELIRTMLLRAIKRRAEKHSSNRSTSL